MKNMLWGGAFGYLIVLLTGFDPSNWQWWALFGGAALGIIINVLD